jgi:hypothetical protein
MVSRAPDRLLLKLVLAVVDRPVSLLLRRTLGTPIELVGPIPFFATDHPPPREHQGRLPTGGFGRSRRRPREGREEDQGVGRNTVPPIRNSIRPAERSSACSSCSSSSSPGGAGVFLLGACLTERAPERGVRGFRASRKILKDSCAKRRVRIHEPPCRVARKAEGRAERLGPVPEEGYPRSAGLFRIMVGERLSKPLPRRFPSPIAHFLGTAVNVRGLARDSMGERGDRKPEGAVT